MKTTTILKRMAGLKVNKTSLVYKMIVDYCKAYDDGRETIIRPCKIYGAKRFITLNDKTDELCLLLDRMKVSYARGNNAPKGGKCGNYVKILKMRKK